MATAIPEWGFPYDAAHSLAVGCVAAQIAAASAWVTLVGGKLLKRLLLVSFAIIFLNFVFLFGLTAYGADLGIETSTSQ